MPDATREPQEAALDLDPSEGERNVPPYLEESNGKDILVWNGAALATAEDGSLSDSQDGLFIADTRMLSTHTLTLEGQAIALLGRIRAQNATGSWTFRNPSLPGGVPEGAAILTLERKLDGALHEDFRVQFFGSKPTRVRLRLDLDSDFADIFEVKEGRVRQREIERRTHDDGLILAYRRGEFSRELRIDISASSSPSCDEHGVTFQLELRPGDEWSYCITYTPVIDGIPARATHDLHPASLPNPALARPTTLKGHGPLAIAFDQGRRDLEALAMSYQGSKPFLGAGVPWFLAVFGRDMLTTTLMSGLTAPWATEGALDVLARLQATIDDPTHDAEPGKFVHELRLGEKARFGEILQAPYYGGHDIPALYCLALWQHWQWNADRSVLERYLPAARRALRWCDEYGDRDGDGFLEYARRASDGYYNQSWKDAEEAIVDEHGIRGAPPLATVEMQGYWYAAQLAVAELLKAVGDQAAAADLERRAGQLRARVEERFWFPEDNCYALALDREKRPLRAVASNAGHLLWCGLPSPEHAQLLAERLLAPDMFSGWGLRTLSASNSAYNPISYQNGSVWPHDTAIAAAGMARYGLHGHANRLIKGLVDASSRMPEHRLPELIAGTDRSSHLLVPHPEANSPQAWGSCTPILLVQAILGLLPDAPGGRCTLDPVLPEWLPSVEVRDVRVGSGRFSARVWREGEATELEVLEADGVEVLRSPQRVGSAA